jgi:hypothetical protein
MNKAIKYISAAIITLAFIFSIIVGNKIVEHLRQDLRKEFSESINKYGVDKK